MQAEQDPEAPPSPSCSTTTKTVATGVTSSPSTSTSLHDHDLGLEEVACLVFSQVVNALERDLKPFFEHLDTRKFLRRCARSVLPAVKYDDLLDQPDFYGPLVLTFSLASCLHFAFKSLDPAPLDRHLGTSLLVCLGTLVCGALLMDVAWQFCAGLDTQRGDAALTQPTASKYGLAPACCLVGYSLFGPCIIILLEGRIWHHLFTLVTIIVELGTGLSLANAVYNGTQGKYGQTLGMAFLAMHVIWLYNIHSLMHAFETVVGEVAETVGVASG